MFKVDDHVRLKGTGWTGRVELVFGNPLFVLVRWDRKRDAFCDEICVDKLEPA